MNTQSGKAQSESGPKVGAIIRARRRQLHLTLQQLSEASATSVGYLSQVERDHATPSLGTLAQIAKALDVGIDYFISTPSTKDALTRANERLKFSVDGSSITYERIGAEFAGSILSSFILTIPPGYRSETVNHEGEEIIYLLDGTLTQRVDDETMILAPGDSLHFRGNRSHSWSNDTASAVRLIWTGTLELFRVRKTGEARRKNSSKAVGVDAPKAEPTPKPEINREISISPQEKRL